MSDSNDGDYGDMEDVNCPVCKEHTVLDSMGAQGMVVTAAKALLSGDDPVILAVAAASDEFTFHVAVTMYLDVLDQYSYLSGVTVDELLDDLRDQLNAAAAAN